MNKRWSMDNKKVAIFLAVVMMVSMVSTMAFADEHATGTVSFTVGEAGYYVDGQWIAADVAPYIEGNRTMVPVAHASRALGAEVSWDAEREMITVMHGDDEISMTIGSVELMSNGMLIENMETAPVIYDLGDGTGRTMLPITRLARVLGVEYSWDADAQKVVFVHESDAVEVDEDVDEDDEAEVTVYDEAGTYGPEEGIKKIEGDVHIKAKDVTLQNMEITGDLIIAEEVGDGDVTLNNITVEELIVEGGGEDSIYINGGKITNVTIKGTPSGGVRVVATDAEGVSVVVAEEAEGKKIILEGTFEKVTVQASGVTLETTGETKVKELTVEQDAADTNITVGEKTTVDTFVADRQSNVTSDGTISSIEGQRAGATRDNMSGSGSRPNIGGTSSGGGGGGGGGGSSTTT